MNKNYDFPIRKRSTMKMLIDTLMEEKTDRHVDSWVWTSIWINITGEEASFGCFGPEMIPTVWAKPKKFKLEIPSQTDVVDGETWRRVKAKVTRKQGFSRRDTSILIALLYFSAKTISVAGMLKHGIQFQYSTQKMIEAFKH